MKKIAKVFAVLTCAALAFSFWSCDNGNEVETYTVTYEDGVDDAEITVPSDSTKYKTGDTVTVKFEGIGERTGYTFAGWSDGTTTYTESGTSTFKMKAADVELTATWTEVKPAPANPAEDDNKEAEEEKQDDTTKPGETTKPTDTTKPGETTKPTDTTKPTNTTKPEDTTKPTDTTPTEPTTPTETTNPTDTSTTTLPANTALQAKITAASAGTSVELTGTSGAGTYISIDKALTVDGKNIEGLTIYVSPSVSSKVTLKNFKKATVKVGSPDTAVRSAFAGRSALWARGAETPASSDEHLKKMGEDALPLYLEGCEIEKFEAEADVALYLENGEKKSEIDELKLKEGVEDFTFIEMDKADRPETTRDEKTPTEDKTKVGDFIIEDGVEKVNLIGGTFDNVALADDFSGKVDFKYDKEFDDQLNFTGKTTFLGDSKIEAKDVAVVEVDNATASGSGVYKFSIPLNDYMKFDARYTVVFMTDEQVRDLAASEFGSLSMSAVASIEHPVYAALPTGAFRIDFEGEKSKPLTIFGSEGGYIDYGAAHARGLSNYEKQDVIVLENYRNYNKDAFIATVDDTNVTIYVNMAEIRKTDIVACVWKEDGDYGEAGSKMTEINLAGYKPYLSLNWQIWEERYRAEHQYPESSLTQEERERFAELGESAHNEDGSLNRDVVPADILAKFDADEQATQNWEAALKSAQSFALATAVKSTHPQANTGMPIAPMIPYGEALKLSWEFMGTFTPMVTSASYPDVSNVVPTVKAVQDPNLYQDIIDNWQDVPELLPEPEPFPEFIPDPEPQGGK